jgi:hypothetical protein
MNPKRNVIIACAVMALIAVITCLALDAPPLVYLILIGVGVVVYFMVAPMVKQAGKLFDEGKIITRDPNFVETAQIFTISKVGTENLIAALKNEGLPFAGLEWKTASDAMRFEYSGWSAQMVKVDCDDSHDKFKFNFTQWQTMKYATVVDITQMNQLLTAIEKAFIKLDSSAKVQTERNKVNTKTVF